MTKQYLYCAGGDGMEPMFTPGDMDSSCEPDNMPQLEMSVSED